MALSDLTLNEVLEKSTDYGRQKVYEWERKHIPQLADRIIGTIDKGKTHLDLYQHPRTDSGFNFKVIKTGPTGAMWEYQLDTGMVYFEELLTRFKVKHLSSDEAVRFVATLNDAELRKFFTKKDDPMLYVAARSTERSREKALEYYYAEDVTEVYYRPDSLRDDLAILGEQQNIPSNAYAQVFNGALVAIAEELKRLGNDESKYQEWGGYYYGNRIIEWARYAAQHHEDRSYQLRVGAFHKQLWAEIEEAVRESVREHNEMRARRDLRNDIPRARRSLEEMLKELRQDLDAAGFDNVTHDLGVADLLTLEREGIGTIDHFEETLGLIKEDDDEES